ncbi:hypothetical protein ScPMuIL_000744 [Solemya velum]
MSDAENNSPSPQKEQSDMNDHKDEPMQEEAEKSNEESTEIEKDEEMKKEVEQKAQTPKKASETPKKSKKKTKKESEDEMEDDDEDDEDSGSPKLGLLEQPVVIESGKRAKKKVERLDMSAGATPKEKKKLEIPEGSGDRLGDCPRIEFQLQKTKADDLKLLHKILYNRVAAANEIRRNIRQFCGYDFAKGDKEYEKKQAMLNKSHIAMLKPVCEVLDIERGGKKEEILERILDFLLNPKDSGKKVPEKKKKKSSGKKKNPGKKSKKDKKETKKKSKATGSSESSEDEASEEEEEEEKESEEEEEEKETEEESEEAESEEESEEEPPKKKKQSKKKPSKKEPVKEKKKENGKKSAKKEKTPKVKSSPKKRKAAAVSDDSSDDEDEPLAKKKRTEPPSNDELKDVIKKILEGANLEEITMKTVVKQVYGKYAQFDLSDRKEFIKNTVKTIIS